MITLVMPYYNNPTMLAEHIRVWSKYTDKDSFKVIIVDDGSQEPAADVFKQYGTPLNTELYRITVDIPWNQDGARNLGMTHAGGWCLLSDMDHVLDYANAQKLMAMPKDDRAAYIPRRLFTDAVEHKSRGVNIFAMHRNQFWSIGGYDESLRGWYGTDRYFKARIPLLQKTDCFALTVYLPNDIADCCTRNYGRKDSAYFIDNNKAISPNQEMTLLNFPWDRVL